MIRNATPIAIWYSLVAGALTDAEIQELRTAAQRVGAVHTNNHLACRLGRPCSICDTRYAAEYELDTIADAAEMIPAGHTVRYAGSLTGLHGDYVCGGLCDCWDCWDCDVDYRTTYRLRDESGAEVLTCVRPTSVWTP